MGLMIGIEVVHPGTTDHASKLAYKVRKSHHDGMQCNQTSEQLT